MALIVSGDVWIHELNGAPPTRLTSVALAVGAERRPPLVASIRVAAIAAHAERPSVPGDFHPAAATAASSPSTDTSRSRSGTAYGELQMDKPDTRENVVALPAATER